MPKKECCNGGERIKWWRCTIKELGGQWSSYINCNSWQDGSGIFEECKEKR
jgi:hypothetical protein